MAKMASRRVIRRVMVGGVAVLGVVGMTATGAAAAPSNAKTALSGTFSDCSNGASGTFVVNSGKSQAINWAVAHLKFASGGRGIFSTTSRDITFTSGGEVVGTEKVSKRAKRNPVTCSIEVVSGDVIGRGTVTGKMTRNGK